MFERQHLAAVTERGTGEQAYFRQAVENHALRLGALDTFHHQLDGLASSRSDEYTTDCSRVGSRLSSEGINS
jgi:hypothetical protein